MNRALLIFAAALVSVANGMHWDNWHVYCSKHTYGHQTHSAKLWHIKGSWTAACESTGANIKHRGEDKWTEFKRPTRCVKNNGMWGEFDVPHAACVPHYGGFEDKGCESTVYGHGIRHGVLLGIPNGFSWVEAVKQTGATIDGVRYDKPNSWFGNYGDHMYGVFLVPDPKCKPKWDHWIDRGCHDGKRRKSAQLTGYTGGAFGGTSASYAMQTDAFVDGHYFERPTWMGSESNIFKGFFEYADPTCGGSVEKGSNGQSAPRTWGDYSAMSRWGGLGTSNYGWPNSFGYPWQTGVTAPSEPSNRQTQEVKKAPTPKAKSANNEFTFCIERDGKFLGLWNDEKHTVFTAPACREREHFQMFSVGDGKNAIRSVAYGYYLSMFPNGELKSMPHNKAREHFVMEKSSDGRLAFRSAVFGDYVGLDDGKWKGMVRRYLTIVPVNY